MRFWLGGAPFSVGSVEKVGPKGDRHPATELGKVFFLPRDSPVARRYYKRNFPGGVDAPGAYRQIYSNRGWLVYAAPGCLASARSALRSPRG
jgi:hypothetical protein